MATALNAASPVDKLILDAKAVVKDASDNHAEVAALSQFSYLAAHGQSDLLGLRNETEASGAKFGSPLATFVVTVDKLRALNDSTDAASTLALIQHVGYMVTVGERVASIAFVGKSGGEWHARVFGTTDLANSLSFALAVTFSDDVSEPTTRFLVRVPALNVIFLGVVHDNKLSLIPLAAHLDGFADGVAHDARKILQKLSEKAKLLNGYPT